MCDSFLAGVGHGLALAMLDDGMVQATVLVNELLSDAASLIVLFARTAGCRIGANNSKGGDEKKHERDTRSWHRHQ